MKKEKIPQRLLDELSETIQSLIPVHSIYLLGAQRVERVYTQFLREKPARQTDDHYEFILLVISQKDIWSTESFMDAVYSRTKQKAKVFSIHYTYEDVLKKLDYGDPFLTKVTNPESLLWQKEPINFLDPGEFTYQEGADEWNRRMNRATYFRDKANLMDAVDDESARMEVIHQVVLHSSIALLWVYMQFRPQHFDLEVLLKLGKMVSKSPDIILPEQSYESQKVFQYLKESHFNLMYRTEPFIPYQDVDDALDRAIIFFGQVQEKGEAILERLKSGESTWSPITGVSADNTETLKTIKKTQPKGKASEKNKSPKKKASPVSKKEKGK